MGSREPDWEKNRPLPSICANALRRVGERECQDKCVNAYVLKGPMRNLPYFPGDCACDEERIAAEAAVPVSLRNKVRINASPMINIQNKSVLCRCIAWSSVV